MEAFFVSAEQTRLEVRFGEAILEAGFTTIPNLVLRHYGQLGIAPNEMMFIIHIWEFWWSEREPYPALATIAERMHMSRRNVRRYVQNLRDKELLIVTERFNDNGQTTSEYDFSPMIRAILELSDPLGHISPTVPDRSVPGPRTPVSSEEDEYEEDEERIRFEIFIQDFAIEFRDRASKASSLTRLVNLYRESKLSIEEFIPLMYEARARTKRSTNVRNKMAYFFSILADLLEEAS